MNLLVLGGTSFAGRRVVEFAVAEGHSVATFNRAGRPTPISSPARSGRCTATGPAATTARWRAPDRSTRSWTCAPTFRLIVASAAAGRTGTYNAVAPPVPLVPVLRAVPPGSGADVVWVPWDFLEKEGVKPWTDLPAWVPAPMAAAVLADGSKVAAAGPDCRPVEEVVADLDLWDRARGPEPLRAGMTRQREAELLRKFASAGAAAPPPEP